MTPETKTPIRESENRNSGSVPMLFLHGMWHGAWCWEQFLEFFSLHGFSCRALSFRGHGACRQPDRLHEWGIPDYVADVENALAEIDAVPVVVAHSMGGFVAQQLMSKLSFPAVFLLASVPPGGIRASARGIARVWPSVAREMETSHCLYKLVESRERAGKVLFSADSPGNVIDSCRVRLQDESYRAFLDMMNPLVPTRKSGTSVHVLGGEDDFLISRVEVEATAKAYGTDPVFFPKTGHDMMLEPAWEDVARYILGYMPP